MTEIYKSYMKMIEQPSEPGFQKMDGYNKPEITYSMILKYLARNGTPRVNYKTEYLDHDIDFVQINTKTKFTKLMCLILEKEQSYTSDRVSVSAVIDPKKNEFTSVVCNGCEGCLCDHGIAFLFWLYRRSNEPSADRPAYWGCNPPKELIDMPIQQLHYLAQQPEKFKNNIQDDINDVIMNDYSARCFDAFLDDLEYYGKTDIPIYRMHRHVDERHQDLFLYHIMSDTDKYQIKNSKSLLICLQRTIKSEIIDEIKAETQALYKSNLWLELQYGRVRCSMLKDITKWKTTEDVDETMIFGSYRMHGDRSSKRKLQKQSILSELAKCNRTNIECCGILLDMAYPHFCATPDGISSELIVEIKVPSTKEEYKKYLINNGKIPPKYFAQIQMQMFMASRDKALYCVASPDFAKNGAVEYISVDLDKGFIEPMVAKAEDVWNNLFFPTIAKHAGCVNR